VNSKARVAVVVSLVLLTAGTALRPVEESVVRMEGATATTARTDNLGAIMGRGMSVAVLGGYRALVADLLWLKAYLAWAAYDLPATQTLVRLVTIVDERPLYFWLNGARIIAYDMTQWRLEKAGRTVPLPAEVRRRIIEEQAEAALRLLADAQRHRPGSAVICVEMANIHLHGRADVTAAARWYRQASELPGAPYYAARIYAELLKRLGRHKEAYAWLRRLHQTLPPNDPEAMSGIVLDRIQDLECILEIPAKERYTAPVIDVTTR
jgi:tetratricopeptide (TPR) repeat protein